MRDRGGVAAVGAGEDIVDRLEVEDPDATVNEMQAAGRDAPLDRLRGQPERPQLLAGDHAVLAVGDLCDQPVEGRLGYFSSVCGVVWPNHGMPRAWPRRCDGSTRKARETHVIL